MSLNCTHTYVKLELSQAAFEEIYAKLKQAGYEHAFRLEPREGCTEEDPRYATVIDMHGLAVVATVEPELPPRVNPLMERKEKHENTDGAVAQGTAACGQPNGANRAVEREADSDPRKPAWLEVQKEWSPLDTDTRGPVETESSPAAVLA